MQMVDHIFSMEAKVVEYIICNLPHSGIFACDIAAAFPSLSRRYLLWVLRSMKIPRRLYRIIKNLHKASFAFVCVRNRLFNQILIASGVKQGDPSAMQLFILAYDPIIRFIDAAFTLLGITCLLIAMILPLLATTLPLLGASLSGVLSSSKRFLHLPLTRIRPSFFPLLRLHNSKTLISYLLWTLGFLPYNLGQSLSILVSSLALMR